VIAAADAEDQPPAGEDVDHGVVLGQPQRMPHRSNVEGAAQLDVLRQVGEVQA
jgi:hypothetical protein